jgi:tether containing UBX domain for GLUT4
VSDPEVKNLSLAQLSLAPSSVLMLTFLDESLNDPILKAPLTEEILAKAQDLPVPVPLDAPKNTGSGSKAKSFGAQKLDAAKAGLPKWLKLSSRGLSSCVRAVIADMQLDRKIVTAACCDCCGCILSVACNI